MAVTEVAKRIPTYVFAAAVFVSAFLLFQIQPVVSKCILPWFGGSPGVWSACLVFFQSVLFFGYAYAHLISGRLQIRAQVILHCCLLLLAVVLLKVIPDDSWKPAAADNPGLRIVLLLAATVGLPYFLLSSTGPLLQRWFSLCCPDESPYRLYAVSNVGSLLALLSYPFVVEPALTLSQQALFWSGGFWVFGIIVIWCGRLVAGGSAAREPTPEPTPESALQQQPRSSRVFRWSWFLPAMTASASLMAFTNKVCQDIAVIPFLWVVPLALYLLSFVLCFDSDRWYHRSITAVAACVLIPCLCWMMIAQGAQNYVLHVVIYFVLLFVICMLCHGEVARIRPDTSALTAYYLTLSAGGACGGLFVAIGAPRLFPGYWELHLCLLSTSVIAVRVLANQWLSQAGRFSARSLVAFAGVVTFVSVGTLLVESVTSFNEAIAVSRNFYGVLRIEDDPDSRGIVMRHGRIVHGLELKGFGGWQQPTTYYSPRSGVGQVFRVLKERQGTLQAGLVGLGAGTLAAYGQEGDTFRFYEINEDVISDAYEYFSFLDRSPARVDVVTGDARLSLDREDPHSFDVLVLDAFSGDAVPTHLLTQESFDVYLKHLQPEGVIAVHISNLYFDLRPVVEAVADAHHLAAIDITVPDARPPIDASSEWMVLCRKAAVLEHPALQGNRLPDQPQRVLWTDDFSNLFQVLRW